MKCLMGVEVKEHVVGGIRVPRFVRAWMWLELSCYRMSVLRWCRQAAGSVQRSTWWIGIGLVLPCWLPFPHGGTLCVVHCKRKLTCGLQPGMNSHVLCQV